MKLKILTLKLAIILYLSVSASSFCVTHQDCQQSQFCTSIYNQEQNKCIKKSLIAKIIGHQIADDQKGHIVSHTLVQINNAEEQEVKQPSKQDNKTSSFMLKSQNQDQSLQVNIQSSNNSSISSFSQQAQSSNFSIKSDSKSIIEIQSNGDISLPKVQFEDVTINAKKLLIDNIPQWQIWHRDDFQENPKAAFDWSDGNYQTSTCSGVTMIGGHCITSKDVLTRKFTKLPDHNQIKIKLNFHFIDAWSGQNAFLKIVTVKNQEKSENPVEKREKLKFTVWNAGYKYTSVSRGLNMCGNQQIDEGKFIQNVEVQFRHNDQSLSVQIGTTLTTDACYSSYGVSDFQIYTL